MIDHPVTAPGDLYPAPRQRSLDKVAEFLKLPQIEMPTTAPTSHRKPISKD